MTSSPKLHVVLIGFKQPVSATCFSGILVFTWLFFFNSPLLQGSAFSLLLSEITIHSVYFSLDHEINPSENEEDLKLVGA